MITKYECNYKKMYQGLSPLQNEIQLVTPRTKLGQLIDSSWHHSWHHSWHWSEDHNEWLDSAKRDLDTEMVYAQKRIADLQQAEKILSLIERETIEEEQPTTNK